MKVYAWTLLTPGAWPNLTQGHDWHNNIFIMRTTKHCYIQNIEALGLLVSEKKIFVSFSHCKSMETIYPRGVAKFDPRGMAGTIYVEDH